MGLGYIYILFTVQLVFLTFLFIYGVSITTDFHQDPFTNANTHNIFNHPLEILIILYIGGVTIEEILQVGLAYRLGMG